MRILLTGGAGFIGSHVTKALCKHGHSIVIIDNLNDYYDPQLKHDRLKTMLKEYEFEFTKADLADYETVKKVFTQHKPDVVCHLAAQAGVRYSFENPWAYERSNIQGTLSVLEAMREHHTSKLVMASTSGVYGLNKKIPFSEQDQTDHQASLYAATKKADEVMCHAYHHIYTMSVTLLRFFTVYGPWGRPDMAMYKFANLMREGKPIDVYNHGEMKRDFTYIDDIVSGIIAAIDYECGYEIFNLGNDKPEQLEDMIHYLEESIGITAQRNYLPMQPGDVTATWADISKAREKLGYNPQTSLKEGIEKFAKWHTWYHDKKRWYFDSP